MTCYIKCDVSFIFIPKPVHSRDNRQLHIETRGTYLSGVDWNTNGACFFSNAITGILPRGLRRMVDPVILLSDNIYANCHKYNRYQLHLLMISKKWWLFAWCNHNGSINDTIFKLNRCFIASLTIFVWGPSNKIYVYAPSPLHHPPTNQLHLCSIVKLKQTPPRTHHASTRQTLKYHAR